VGMELRLNISIVETARATFIKGAHQRDVGSTRINLRTDCPVHTEDFMIRRSGKTIIRHDPSLPLIDNTIMVDEVHAIPYQMVQCHLLYRYKPRVRQDERPFRDTLLTDVTLRLLAVVLRHLIAIQDGGEQRVRVCVMLECLEQ